MAEKKKIFGKVTGKVKGFFSDFKKFISKGNILDLAVAVIIGGAFGKIVSSLVNDIIMPLIALAIGGSVDSWKWVITPAQIDAATGEILAAENALRYGMFIQAIMDFLIIAFFIFLALRIVISLSKEFGKLESGYKTLNKTEHKALVSELKAEGKSRAEIKAAIAANEAAIAAAAIAEAEANRPATSEELLTQIRDLLIAQQNSASVEMENLKISE